MEKIKDLLVCSIEEQLERVRLAEQNRKIDTFDELCLKWSKRFGETVDYIAKRFNSALISLLAKNPDWMNSRTDLWIANVTRRYTYIYLKMEEQGKKEKMEVDKL